MTLWNVWDGDKMILATTDESKVQELLDEDDSLKVVGWG